MPDLDDAYRSGKTPKQKADSNKRTEAADKKLAAKLSRNQKNS